MVLKIDRQELQLRFLEALDGADYRFIEGLNPFHILLNGTEYWIYIKNLTSAHFTNPEVWRAQLPLRDDFQTIKDSDIDFIMLGYDGDNDVYATWNPVWVKQRLNSTDNVSLYSRYNLQVEARQSFQLKRMDLGNDGEVIVFPREMTRLFFTNVSSYFLNTGDYVAMGSKRRPEANESFKILTNPANIEGFARHMTDEGFSAITTGSYCRAIKSLISDGQFSRNRKVFLQYDSIEEYKQAVSQFIEIPDIAQKNIQWHYLISAALKAYISYLCKDKSSQPENTVELQQDGEALVPSPSEVVYQPNADDRFAHFCDYETVARFERSLFHKDYLRSTVKRYSRAIRYLIKQGLLERYKDVFVSKSSYSQYQGAADEFFKIPEIKTLNEDRHHDYSAAMKQYIEYLVKSDSYVAPAESSSVLESSRPVKQDVEKQVETPPRDWEAEFTDQDGKLTRIASPVLLEKLRPVLDREYPNVASAFNIVEDFYGARFKEMEFFEWGRLFKQIDWANPIPHAGTDIVHDTPSRKAKTVILRVELPDGRIIEHKNVSTTYCEAILAIGPEEVSILGICHAGVNIVSRELDERYADYQRDIGDGWYVMTNSPTPVKYQDLQKIIQEYGVNMKVDIVPLDPSSAASIVTQNSSNTSRAKIKVVFPDGRTIQPAKVLDALIEVVKYAGVKRVREINIICCNDNLILEHPKHLYEKHCKPVGEGLFCNTYSNTIRKYEQIQTISDSLGLGLKVELVQ